MGTHLTVLSENYPINTNMTGFRWFSKIFAFLLWRKVSSALEGLYGKMGINDPEPYTEHMHYAIVQP